MTMTLEVYAHALPDSETDSQVGTTADFASPPRELTRDPSPSRYDHSLMAGPIRLERQASVGGQAGVATAIGILMVAIGVATIIAMRADESQPTENEWVLYAVGLGFAVVGLLVAVLGLKTFLMLRIPQRSSKSIGCRLSPASHSS